MRDNTKINEEIFRYIEASQNQCRTILSALKKDADSDCGLIKVSDDLLIFISLNQFSTDLIQTKLRL